MKALRASRGALLAFAGIALVSGVAGGLMRLGVPIVVPMGAAFHGALMICGFLGTVISLERAVALGGKLAFAAPASAALGTVLALAGRPAAAAIAWLAASVFLLVASLAIVRKQPMAHTILLAIAAAAWIAGNAFHALGQLHAAITWWFAFVILTIAAERLELARLMPRRRSAKPVFIATIGGILAGAALTALDARLGAIVFGASLVALAAWLAMFDVARRTVRFAGLARFAAVSLLGGYGWLAVGAVAWIMTAAGDMRWLDASLHALAIGFVISMILAHAPIVLQAVMRVRIAYSPIFYVPLGLLHVSLGLRLIAGFGDAHARMWGGVLNAIVFVLLIGTIVYQVSFGHGNDGRSTGEHDRGRPGARAPRRA